MMARRKNDDAFVTVSNKDIYDKLLEIEAHIIVTNGKVKKALWAATTAMALIVALIFAHIPKG
jgi:hypothetical protein